MKRPVLYFTCLAIAAFLYSCSQGNEKSKASKAKEETPLDSTCYVAIDAKDTAHLVLRRFEDGKYKGHLLINYVDKGKNDGQVEGAFTGDTLFVDYTFKIGTVNKTVYKNPLAFLRKDGNLLLGVGQIVTHVGRSYFDKAKPISFDKGRFTFKPTDCRK